jgi:hypothetical protein
MSAITAKAYDLLVLNKHQKGVTTLSITVKKYQKTLERLGFGLTGYGTSA